MISLISLTCLILSVNGITQFVIDNYTIPDPSNNLELTPTASPFPIGVCLNYRVELDGLTLTPYYGKYECNNVGATYPIGSEVIFTDFGLDSTCESGNEVAQESSRDHTFTFDVTASPGDVGTFNCVGEENYVQVAAYTVIGNKAGQVDGGRICCGDSEESVIGTIITTFATELCAPVPDSDPQAYIQGECTGDASGSYLYTDATCETPVADSEPDNTADADYCELFAADIASVYRMQLNCVFNGTMEEPSKMACTDSPTASPTTSAPTLEPTMDPTKRPTEKEKNDSKGYTYSPLINYINIALLSIAMIVFN